jgi:proteasome lid subunit RPN8/RPN11
MINSQLIAAIREQAYARPDQEVCGLIIDAERLYPCDNVSPEPNKFAVISPEQMALADNLGEITHHYHSHVEADNLDFSVDDIKSCRGQLRIPWVLCHTPTGQMRYYDPDNRPPLVGRDWSWSHQNCFNIFQDYFWSLGIKIDDFYLDHPRAWAGNKSVGYLENLGSQGFTQLSAETRVQNHDVILQWAGQFTSGPRKRAPNHIGIIIDSSKNHILHHEENSLSRVDVYGDRKTTHSVWRHHKFL